jgi:repressor LexA
MKKRELHPSQQQLLLLLKQNMDDPLTIRDLQEEAGISSPSLVFHHLQQLEKNGYVKRNPSNPRDYQVLADSPEKKVAYLNLYGLAQCGPKGRMLNDNPIDRVAVASRLLTFPASEGFLVKAKGDSMEPKIHEGDLVMVRKSPEIKDDSVVVCVNNEEALIKKIKKVGKQIFLFSTNELVKPFPAAKDFRVVGEVRGVISYQM